MSRTIDTAAAVRFLTALFAPGDTILLRPIETWTQGDKKQSQVDYKGIQYPFVGLRDQDGQWQPMPEHMERVLGSMHQRSEQTRANLFFGVCPRFGGHGKYDLAWQIRTVRSLWVDVDHCAVDDAIKRCTTAGLPQPSIVVSSGNGAHLYWLLESPFLIDDAGDPTPVFTEFVERGEGRKKKPRKYVKGTDGEKLYLDVPSNKPALSANAQHLQDIIAGIASKIGGDHTQDLSRLLRLPGTWNRKDQRNGKEPVPCTLVECDPTRCYGIDQFQKFAAESPATQQRQRLESVRLPTHRKLTPTRKDKLHELLAACGLAEQGARSERDFALCCFAIKVGMTREALWGEAQSVGKFRERGEEYFNRTWAAAEAEVRTKILAKVEADSKAEAKQMVEAGAGADEVGTVKLLADMITADNQFARDAGAKLYRYVGGVYRPKAETFIKSQVKGLVNKLEMTSEWSSRLATEVVEYLLADAPELWERPPLDMINVKNGLLRVDDGVLLPHGPEHLSAVQLPITYDPAATCPAIDQFVEEVFPSDAHDLAYEIPGWLMRPVTDIQKAILLLGSGGNGKSVWLRLLVAFLGKINTSALSLHKLESDRFAAARLIGKLANICPDLPTEHLAGTSMFKAITGGDVITGEYKFKDSFDFVPFARLVFSANNPPRSQDSSQGFFDRWLVIPFDRSFRGTEKEIPSNVLDERLQAPGELSGLLNKALDSLKRIGGTCGFSQPESAQAAWRNFHASIDPLAVWLDQYTVDDPDAFVVRKTLRVAFNGHLERQGRPAMSETAFGLAFPKLRPNAECKRRTVAGRQEHCYIGIGLVHSDRNDNSAGHSCQGSQGIPSINQSQARARNQEGKGCCSGAEQRRANPGKGGNHDTDDHCENGGAHAWLDSAESDGKTRRFCRVCNKFGGFVCPDGVVVQKIEELDAVNQRTA